MTDTDAEITGDDLLDGVEASGSDLRELLSAVISDDAVTRLTDLTNESQITAFEKPEPDEDQVSYPDSMDAIDRVMHVLVNESSRTLPLSWISTAADVPEDDCWVILCVLASVGVVMSPEGTVLNGYQLNPYYKFYRDIDRRVDIYDNVNL